MGRHPNPVVSKHFTRGTKIGDGSNRYQWTCKQCGERFPKGRVDALYVHITKKCTALSRDEKTSLELELHETSLAVSTVCSQKNKVNLQKSKKGVDPLWKPPEKDLDALNMLAEVSGQAVETQCNHAPRLAGGDGNSDHSMVLDPALDSNFCAGRLSSGMNDERCAVGNGELLDKL